MTSTRNPFDDKAITLRSAEDLLAVVPYCLGFRPHESLVVMSVRSPVGPRGSRGLGLTARIDLADVVRDHSSCELLAEHLRRDCAEFAFVAVYSRALDGEVEDVLRRFLLALDAAGVPVMDCVHVSDVSWRSMLCDDNLCCPTEGKPLSQLLDSPVGPQMVLRGATVAAERGDRLAFTDPDAAPRVHEVTRRAWATIRRGGPTAVGNTRAFGLWRRLVDEALTSRSDGRPSQPATDAQIAQLASAMFRVRFRDALLVDTVLDWTDTFTALEGDLDGLAVVFDGGERPDTERVDAIRAVLGEVIRSTDGVFRANALAALGWIEWYSGDLAMARDLAELALDIHEAQSMAGLVWQLSTAGLPPGWVRSVAGLGESA